MILAGVALPDGEVAQHLDEHAADHAAGVEPAAVEVGHIVRILHRLAAASGVHVVINGSDQRLKFLAAQLDMQVFRTGRIRADKRERDARGHQARKLAFGFFRCFGDAAERLDVTVHIHPVLLLDLFADPIHQATIDAVAAQKRIAARGQNFKDIAVNFEN